MKTGWRIILVVVLAAVLLGAVGGNVGTSRWYRVAPELRPEAALLRIRKEMGLFANIRPASLYPELAGACPLKEEFHKLLPELF